MSTVIAWSTALVALVWLGDAISSRSATHSRSNVKRPPCWLQPWGDISLAVFTACGAAALLADAGTLRLDPVGPFLQALGLLASLAALVLSIRARVEMGDNFAADVRVWDEQELVTRGLFSLVRHPIYLGTIAMWLGVGIGILSWPLLATGLAVIIPTSYLRAKREEQLMTERVGLDYCRYREKVPMLSPWPRPRPSLNAEDQPNVAEQE